jgi:hypothetical protein
LLIRFPGLQQAARLSVALTILRLMVANLEKRELLSLCRRVNQAHDCLEALQTLEIFESANEMEKRIHNGVRNAQGLTDRFVLMLYWLLRKRGAKDFSYERNLTPASKVMALRKRYGADSEPMGLIRFSGHLPKGGYDVPTDGRHTQAPAAPAVR